MRIIEIEDINEVLLTRLFLAEDIFVDRVVPEQRYFDSGLRLTIDDDMQDRIVNELLGFRTYRTREQIIRVLERRMGWVSALEPASLDLISMWADIAERHLVDRHPFVVKSDQYESWRRHIHGLDEDTPGLCLLACKHANEITSRESLFNRLRNWPTYLRGDESPLYQELSKGFACLHLHLSATYPAPYFWVGLMNNRFKVEDVLPRDNPASEDDEEDKLYRYIDQESVHYLRRAIVRAQHLRWQLEPLADKIVSQGCPNLKTSDLLGLVDLNKIRALFPSAANDGYEIPPDQTKDLYDQIKKKRAGRTDYLQPSYFTNIDDAVCPSLITERAFNFAIIWALGELADEQESQPLSAAYWSYLEAKHGLLNIAQQGKRAAGFSYFRWALDRLNWDEDAASGREIGCFLQESRSLTHLELMVSPKSSPDKYDNTLKLVDNIQKVMSEKLHPHLPNSVKVGLILHFIKDEGTPFTTRVSPDDLKKNEEAHAFTIYHAKCRDRNLSSLPPLKEFVEQQKAGGSPTVPILAIDAANYEEYCPPEVFAQVYEEAPEYVGLHISERDYRPLRRTFHVGEVFPHVATGLRRIYEAVTFLGLQPGDRLGHASALGIDVREWLRVNPRVDLTRIDVLDDAVFELHLLQQYQPEQHARINELQGRIAEYSRVIFGEPVDPTVLIKSWLSRGERMPNWVGPDDGKKYDAIENVPAWVRLQGELMNLDQYTIKPTADGPQKNPYGEEPGAHSIVPSLFQLAQIRSAHGLSGTELGKKKGRSKANAAIDGLPPDQAIRILYEYLYDERTVRKFVRTVNIDVSGQTKNLQTLQAILRSFLSDRGINIESNPTSNWLIGGWESHADVPAVQWLKHFPEVAVTVNPDDPSIFSTSPENEYFFVFAALLHAGDDGLSRNEALECIRKLRNTSLEASFLD